MEILEALQGIGLAMALQNIRAEIILLGDTSLCLVHNVRDRISDVDVLFSHPKEIIQAAQTIAWKNKWNPDWLNNSAIYFSNLNPPKIFLYSLMGLDIYTVTSEYLLAMKLIMNNGNSIDSQDIHFLGKLLNYSDYKEFLLLAENHFPDKKLSYKTYAIINTYLKSNREGKG